VVSFAGETFFDEEIMPVGGANPYLVRSKVFTASSEQGLLMFQHTSPVGDHTLLIDNVMILPGDQTPRPTLRISRGPGASARLSWAVSEGSNWEVRFSTDVAAPANQWQGPLGPVFIEGDEYVVYDETTAPMKFYRMMSMQ
jgi:hypothetical protein